MFDPVDGGEEKRGERKSNKCLLICTKRVCNGGTYEGQMRQTGITSLEETLLSIHSMFRGKRGDIHKRLVFFPSVHKNYGNRSGYTARTSFPTSGIKEFFSAFKNTD